MTSPPSSSHDRLSVLVVSTRFPPDVEGGYEKSCALVADRLRARGHRVTVVARRGPADAPPDVYRRLFYRFSGNRRLLVTGWLYDLLDLRAIRRIMDESHPDIVYLWGITGACLPVVATLTRRLPTVVYIADYWLSLWLSGQRLPDGFAHQLKVLAQRPLTPWKPVNQVIQQACSPIYRRMYPKWLTVAPYIVHFDSNHMAAETRSQGIVLARERVVHHGIEIARFPYAAPAERPVEQAHGILFVGRVVPVKGIETLLRALPAILATVPGARLTVAGPVDADYSARLGKLAADLGVSHAVVMLGPKPQEDLVELYHQHELLVFPSEWDEPFGIVLVEAMACGIPVLCSAAGGSAEIVDGVTTGLRFRRGDAEDLAANAIRLMQSSELRERLSQEARRRTEQQFELDHMVTVIERDLQEARDSRPWLDR